MTLNLSQTLFWLCMIFVVSALYGVPMSGVMVTLSSLMLSLAFAFGSVASSVIFGILFKYVLSLTRPGADGEFCDFYIRG